MSFSAGGITVGNVGLDQKTGSLKVEGMETAGFDTGKVTKAVQAGIDAEKIRPQKEIETGEKRLNAMAEIQLVAMAYAESLKFLQGANIVETKSGIFGIPTAEFGMRQDGQPASKSFSIMLSAGTPPQTLDVAIIKLAEQDKVKGATLIADQTVALGITGTLVIPHKDGISPALTVTLDPTDSADSVRNKVNAFKDSTGVSAMLIPSGTGYKLEFLTPEFSKPLAFTKNITGGDGTLVPEPSVRTKSSLQLQVQINGESSQYDTNSPALKTMGFTLTAFEPTQATGAPAAPASVKFVYNNLEISTRIQDWVQARNDLTKVIDKYASMDIDSLNLTPEEKKDFQLGLLTHNSALMELDRHIGFSLQKSVGGITAATLGMTSEGGLLVVNAKTLNEKILNDFEGVKKFFTYNETSTNPKFQTTTHPETILTDIVTNPLNITVNNVGGTLGAFFQIQGQAGLIQAGEITQVGNTLQIKADPNSTLKGFTFFYDGTLADGEQATTSMQFSQGIGDTSIEFFERAFGDKGLFLQSSSTFAKEIKTQQEKIDRIEKSGQHKLQMLEQRLAAAVKAIAAITAIINQVRAMNQMQYAAAAV